MSTRPPVWEAYFQAFGHTTRSKSVLQWLKQGLLVQWVPVNGESQVAHPRFERRLQLVKELLGPTVGPEAVVAKLQGSRHRDSARHGHHHAAMLLQSARSVMTTVITVS